MLQARLSFLNKYGITQNSQDLMKINGLYMYILIEFSIELIIQTDKIKINEKMVSQMMKMNKITYRTKTNN